MTEPHRNPSSTPPPDGPMIEAGIAASRGMCPGGYQLQSDQLTAIYLAMHAARSNQEATDNGGTYFEAMKAAADRIAELEALLATRTVGDAELVAELKATMKGATARPWVAFDSGDASKATLAIMKGRRPKKRADNRFVRWPEIIAWSGFDAADVPHAQRRANLHLIVEVVNALPRIIDALSHTSSCGGI